MEKGVRKNNVDVNKGSLKANALKHFEEVPCWSRGIIFKSNLKKRE